jgi:hypothetical protein
MTETSVLDLRNSSPRQCLHYSLGWPKSMFSQEDCKLNSKWRLVDRESEALPSGTRARSLHHLVAGRAESDVLSAAQNKF